MAFLFAWGMTQYQMGANFDVTTWGILLQGILICTLRRGDIKEALTGIVAGSLILKFKFYQNAG